MRTITFALVLVGAGCSAPETNQLAPRDVEGPRWGIAIHTGAGAFTLDSLGDRQEPMRSTMVEALTAGQRVLAGGGSSLDAVQAAIVILEDSPMFNAGRGAVFSNEGKNELDASLMDGATRRAGAVAGVTHIRNPIALARLVMDKSPHVMLSGPGAEAFAAQQGLELVPASYFHTDRAWAALQGALDAERKKIPSPQSYDGTARADSTAYFGTVGAVALDQYGNLAAGTSTGGMTNKRWGRIGDSPIVGAGTYASNQSCAISSTGHGEFFIRYTVAHDVCARVEYGSVTLQQAADVVVQEVLKAAGGEGGVIGMDRLGNVAWSVNVSGMGRGYMGADGRPLVMFTEADAVALPGGR
jgi:beta-aspartyl-peptidase (threonine type)